MEPSQSLPHWQDLKWWQPQKRDGGGEERESKRAHQSFPPEQFRLCTLEKNVVSTMPHEGQGKQCCFIHYFSMEVRTTAWLRPKNAHLPPSLSGPLPACQPAASSTVSLHMPGNISIFFHQHLGNKLNNATSLHFFTDSKSMYWITNYINKARKMCFKKEKKRKKRE